MTMIAGLAVAGCTAAGELPPPPAAGTAQTIAAPTPAEANAAFEKLGAAYIDIVTAMNPVAATQMGDHAHDGELPAIDGAARTRQAMMDRELLQALAAIDPALLTRDNQVDYALLKNAVEYDLWDVETLQTWAWNPQYYNDIASQALYSLVARDFAPWPERFRHIVERMEKLPAFLAEARVQLDPARVPKVHAETVARQNAGIMEIVDAALLPEVERSDVDRTRFDAALSNLKAALAEHQNWLDNVLVPNARGEFRLGTELYDTKMRFALMSPMTRPELKAQAEAAFAEARSEMERLARTFPDCDNGSQQQAIECALAKSYAKRATRETLEQTARETLAQATAFTAEKGFVGMPEGPVQVITMPKFWQGNAVAYDDAPGPLEQDLPNYYAVSPIPEDWTDEQAESFLTEYNLYMLHDLSIHEGVPGHYLQLDHSRRNDNLLRAVLMSGPFVEGWAVYAERVMAEQGYLGGEQSVDGKLFALTMLKMRLRSITNTLLDIGIHTEGMTREQAMTLMMEGAFQQEREAAGKWTRANLSSVQLLSYFTGYEEHMALRREAMERWGTSFDLRRYHDTALSFGSPPVKYVRALMFDLPVE
ncbi:DUF885 family protein [Altererythrobacter soli]|uniref:DUF885 family protein n=2 Tax=Croceibacterium soli TaxID=1739690 RepID=A0A6I4USB5_9SPHN|nr:DUF885 family protein [Croceibacterium soli]